MPSGMRWTEEQLAEFRKRAAEPLVLNRIPCSLPAPGVDAAKQALPAGKAAELSLRAQIVEAGLPEPYREFTFDDTRDWRLDLAWPSHKLAVEIDGSVHRTKERFARDIEKLNEAGIAGWMVIRVRPEQVRGGQALSIVVRALSARNVRAPAAAEGETLAEVSVEHVRPQRSAIGVAPIQSAPKQCCETGSKRTGS